MHVVLRYDVFWRADFVEFAVGETPSCEVKCCCVVMLLGSRELPLPLADMVYTTHHYLYTTSPSPIVQEVPSR